MNIETLEEYEAKIKGEAVKLHEQMRRLAVSINRAEGALALLASLKHECAEANGAVEHAEPCKKK